MEPHHRAGPRRHNAGARSSSCGCRHRVPGAAVDKATGGAFADADHWLARHRLRRPLAPSLEEKGDAVHKSRCRCTHAAQCTAGKFVSNFSLISITFSPVKPPPAASSETVLK